MQLGIVGNEPVAQFEIGRYRNFTYLVLDWKSRQSAIIDPQEDLSQVLEALKEHDFTLNQLLLTHTHFDHTAGIAPLLRIQPKSPILFHELEGHRIKDLLTSAGARTVHLHDGDDIPVGSLHLKVLHTPGHSAGACSFFLPSMPHPYLFSGDTLFIRDCGRTDLDTASPREMFASLQRIKQLPPDTIILPGHRYTRETASTLSQELRDSPPLRCRSVEELDALP